MAKNKIERIDQEIAKVREDRRVSGKAQGAGGTENRGRKSGDRPDGARTAYDPGSAERHAVRRHSSRQFC